MELVPDEDFGSEAGVSQGSGERVAESVAKVGGVACAGPVSLGSPAVVAPAMDLDLGGRSPASGPLEEAAEVAVPGLGGVEVRIDEDEQIRVPKRASCETREACGLA